MRNCLAPLACVSLLVTILATVGCHSLNATDCGRCSTALPTAAAPTTKASQAALTPEQALAELKAGNARFVSGHARFRRPLDDAAATSAGQYPIAIVLSCIDSRQPIELVLDQGIGDIFSARVAGNVLNDDILGSMEFACKVSGAKAIAVIGHSNCGAIKGAIDNVQLGNLTGLLAHIRPILDQIPENGKPRSSKNHDLVEAVSEANVRLVMQEIRERSPILREMLDRGQIVLAGGEYDLASGRVTFFSQ